MTSVYENLSWLPKAPEDFNQRLSNAKTGGELNALAKFSLSDSQLLRLCKKLRLLENDHSTLLPLAQVSIGVVSNSTTKLMVPALVGTALRFGIALQVIEAEFNQVAQEAFSSESVFLGHKLSSILVAIDYRGLPFSPQPGNTGQAEKNVQDCLVYMRSIVASLQSKTGAQVILQNIAPPAEKLTGSFERRLPGSLAWLISHLNNELDSLVDADTLILDIAGLAANLGLENWHNPTLWNVAKLSFSQRYIPIYSDFVCRILAAKLGKSRRCLILDLDNTLWGGVIGDDGVEGILIGNGNPTGEAHLDVQRIALGLRELGIVLAISSKNEDAIARKPFKEHPDMVLRENHLAVFQANWSDKASNIKAIASALSLGLESMVFLDDNPAERLQVRSVLPEVAVPELPDDPALYSRTLIAAGYFEAISFSAEDLKRASFYQDNAMRTQILNESSDLNGYLRSLDMEMYLSEFDASGRPRITQLISKSNQFNLTTKRYGEIEVKNLEGNNRFFTRQVRLKDKLGDNGMISVVICKKELNYWEIDTWLMSCRVLGRQVELAVLGDIVKHAMADNVPKLVGIFRPTARNIIVKDHYKKLGFIKISEEKEFETWSLDVAKYEFPEVPIKIKNFKI